MIPANDHLHCLDINQLEEELATFSDADLRTAGSDVPPDYRASDIIAGEIKRRGIDCDRLYEAGRHVAEPRCYLGRATAQRYGRQSVGRGERDGAVTAEPAPVTRAREAANDQMEAVRHRAEWVYVVAIIGLGGLIYAPWIIEGARTLIGAMR